MSDSGWATVVGLGVIITLRLLDYFLPKGRAFKWSVKHSIQVEKTDNPIDGVADYKEKEGSP